MSVMFKVDFDQNLKWVVDDDFFFWYDWVVIEINYVPINNVLTLNSRMFLA